MRRPRATRLAAAGLASLLDAAGQVVTATATDPEGNTSEFSACVPVEFGTLPTSVPTLDARTLAALAILLGAGGTIVLARSRLP